jgi:anthranilate phosphoribosyltransferase
MKAILEALLAGRDLEEAEAGELLRGMTSSTVPEALKGAVLAALRAKGETGAELRGMALAMRRAAVPIVVPGGTPVVDTCGTGGDGSHSFNVSTAAALVVASAGVKVVKHGNRSVSSKCGSADVLEVLGINLVAGPEQALRQLEELDFTFLFAPAFHPAMKAVAPVRQAMGVRTVFNLLGPLSNPAAPPFQLVGAYSVEAARVLAEALSGMPIERCFVVHGAPSWDEATPCGPFLRFDVRPGRVVELEIDPLFTYGVPRCSAESLAGGDAAHNARLLRQLMAGAHGPIRDAVLLNAALVLELVGRAETPRRAFELAAEVLDSGRGTWFLDRLDRPA